MKDFKELLLQNYIRRKYFFQDNLEEINERNFGEGPKYKEESNGS